MVPRTCATARTCAHIFMALFMHVRSHGAAFSRCNDMHLVGISSYDTVNESSVASGLEITFLGTLTDDSPFQA